jgi:hypothetical protein
MDRWGAVNDFLGDILDLVGNTGAVFSEHAYHIIGNQIAPLLDVMLIVYLAFYGVHLVTDDRPGAAHGVHRHTDKKLELF